MPRRRRGGHADIGNGEPATVTLTGNRDLSKRMPLFDVFALFSLASLILAIGSGKPEVLAVGAPFLVAVALSIALWRPVDGQVTVDVRPRRVAEGDTITVEVGLSSGAGLDRVEVEIAGSDRLSAEGTLRGVTHVRPDHTTLLRFVMTAEQWGVATINKLSIRTTDRLGLFGGQLDIDPELTLHIGLPEDRVQASLEAERFRRIVGSHQSNDRGQGLEIADIRQFQPGDSSRQINWRISNRRGEPWVTLRHPDRSTTVIVIVDAHDGDDAEQLATQRRSVAAAMALTRGHLAMHDRVGLLVVGHTLKWLPPRLGRNQLYSIGDQLVAVGNAPEASRRMYRPPAVSSIPNDAIVVAVSPLRDPLMVALIAEVRSHGNPVSVLVPQAAGGARQRSSRSVRRVDQLARRLAAAEQAIGMHSLRERGVAIVDWPADQPVVTVVDSVRRLRNSMARTRSS